jgi:telomerase Cajal body protein 1
MNLDLVGHTFDTYFSTYQSWSQEYADAIDNNQLGPPPHNNPTLAKQGPNIFKSSEFAPDGSCIVTTNEDCALRLYIIPPDILDDAENGPRLLMPYSRRFGPTAILSSSVYPGFNLSDYATCVVAVSRRDVPLKLYNVLDSESLAVASFSLIRNDYFLPIYSTCFDKNSGAIACGSKNLTAIFDSSISGHEPLLESRCKGNVSAVDSRQDLIATGTFEGITSLLDVTSGDHVARCENNKAALQLMWSKTNNHEIYRVSRNHTQIDILDTRMNLAVSRRLSNWHGTTKQRLTIDQDEYGGCYAGGIDGNIHFWKNHISEPVTFKAHDSAISSVSLHPILGAEFLSTSSGDRDSSECSFKLWQQSTMRPTCG